MKKIVIISMVAAMFSTAANAAARESPNPMFGDANNQIGFYGGWGTDARTLYPDLTHFVPFGILQLQYSQPITFLRLPGRVNVQVGGMAGWGKKDGEDWRDYNHFLAALTWDVALIHWRQLYFGAGLGIAMKSGTDVRQDSRVMFTPRLFLGYHFADRWGVEAFFQHYSDGNLTPVNGSYNFIGLGVTYRF